MFIDWRDFFELPDIECPNPAAQGDGRTRGASETAFDPPI
jgi:hypothetical protein